MIVIPNGPTIYSKDELAAMGYGGYVGWSDPEAGLDFAATGGGGKWTGGGAGPGGAGSTSGGAFSFNWEQAEADALEKLRPYYEEVLAEARGDVERAKQIIEEDYQRGVRYREEDLQVAQEGWAREEPRQRNALLEDLNRRGFLQSSIRTGEEEYLTETQTATREATERALQRQEELAGVERSRGVEELDIKLPRYERELMEEKKTKAADMATMKYGRDYDKWLAEASRFIG
jgi:hypothetical protein